MRRHLGALVARRHVIDHPTWCGAATTTLCGGRGDPHLLWRSSLVELGAMVIVIVLMKETWWPIYTPHPGHLKLAGVARLPTHTQEHHQAIQEHQDHISPSVVLSFDHQNHSKWHKWCHVRFTDEIGQ